ncbi:hypothetical protein QBC40DRAFT_32188 [Triangularia verruculosa]|uniref:Uncharacterized protein n=1 Tax=Triangularia verruculosa TaxID=2587418 RepID=A0AAN6XR77_9PEZI|nr:hypothetical protein QBC40DRAFT_32188 [Triangularia verruculosa]
MILFSQLLGFISWAVGYLIPPLVRDVMVEQSLQNKFMMDNFFLVAIYFVFLVRGGFLDLILCYYLLKFYGGWLWILSYTRTHTRTHIAIFVVGMNELGGTGLKLFFFFNIGRFICCGFMYRVVCCCCFCKGINFETFLIISL